MTFRPVVPMLAFFVAPGIEICAMLCKCANEFQAAHAFGSRRGRIFVAQTGFASDIARKARFFREIPVGA